MLLVWAIWQLKWGNSNMHLLLDSGATKTEGVLFVGNDEQRLFDFEGIHPLFENAEQITAKILRQDLPFDAILSVEYYGTGCSTSERVELIKGVITKVFPNLKELSVAHDLLSAARCHMSLSPPPYVSCILGTGANAGYFDGNTLQQRTPSLGFLLGDEGSGADIGKHLLRDYLYQKTPHAITQVLDDFFQLKKEDIISNLYRSSYPNRYLASLVRAIHPVRQEDYITELITQRFLAFKDQHLQVWSDQTDRLTFVGGVAYNFKDLLVDCCSDWRIVSVTDRPIIGLADRYKRI